MDFWQRQRKNAGLLIILILLFFNLNFWSYGWLGWVLFAGYLLLLGEYWRMIFRKVLWLSRKLWVTKVFSYLTVFLLLSFTASIFIVFDRLTPFLIWLSYAVSFVLSLVIFYLVHNSKKVNQVLDNQSIKKLVFFKQTFILPITYFVLWLVGFYFLYQNQSAEIVNSPWQVIRQHYSLIFFVLILFSAIFLLSKYKTKTILFIFLLQSILFNLYIPIAFQLPWGGDVDRYVVNEENLIQGEQILPVLIGSEASWVEILKADIPEVFLSSNKYNYGQLWGSTVLLSQTLQMDLDTVNRWLIPIIWSIVIPSILFRLGWVVFGSVRLGLWLSWFTFLLFPFQSWGGWTLSMALAFISFIFTLMLWLHYLRDGRASQRNLVFLFAFLMLFGNSFGFILIWLIIIFSLIIPKKIRSKFYRFLSLNKI